MKRIIALLITIVLTLCLCACQGSGKDGSSSAADLSSQGESTPNSSETDGLSEYTSPYQQGLDSTVEVEYERVKSILCGSYTYFLPSIFSNSFIFFEDGRYIIMDHTDGKRCTPENSSLRFFLTNNKEFETVVVSLTREDGRKIEAVLSEYGGHNILENGELNDVNPLIKSSSKWNSKETYLFDYSNYGYFLTLDDFDKIEVGKTDIVADELIEVIKASREESIKEYFILVTADGNLMEFPLKDGRYVWLRFGENYIISDIEISDRPCRLYNLIWNEIIPDESGCA